MIVIGIDPDFKASGVAIMRDGVIEELLMVKLWDMPKFIRAHATATFVLENVNKDKAVYRAGHVKGAKNPLAVAARKGVDVGKVQCVCTHLEEALKDAGVKYLLVDPIKGPLKKLKGEKFNQVTGWKGRSNQDTRDAGMLAWAYK